MLDQTIIYDPECKWRAENKSIRLRKYGDTTKLTYKERKDSSVDGSKEIEFEVGDYDKARALFEKMNFIPFRREQKIRHTFLLNGVTVDIDTWPKIPTYVELEGESEDHLREIASILGFNWNDVVFDNAGVILEKYGIPIGELHEFTFDSYK